MSSPGSNTARNALVVLGPTASGKTGLGVQLAHAHGGEVVSVDSRQVYRGLDIGSGKDLAAYTIDHTTIPYHLIDIVDLGVEYNVFQFQQDCFQVLEQLWARETLPVLVGGTGMYLEAVLQGYRMVEAPKDPALRQQLASLSTEALQDKLRTLQPRQHNSTDLLDRDRLLRALEIAHYTRLNPPPAAPDIRPLVLGIQWERATLRQRIAQRLKDRLEEGLLEEVEDLHARGYTWERLELLGLEYRFVAQYLQGNIKNRNDLFQKLFTAICQFAKRQETWFRRMERRGQPIHWLPGADRNAAEKIMGEQPWDVPLSGI